MQSALASELNLIKHWTGQNAKLVILQPNCNHLVQNFQTSTSSKFRPHGPCSYDTVKWNILWSRQLSVKDVTSKAIIKDISKTPKPNLINSGILESHWNINQG